MTVNLVKEEGEIGETARRLMADISKAVSKGISNDSERYSDDVFFMLFQPQYDIKGEFQGAEALIRFNHPIAGFIYPPLIIEIAKEGGFLGYFEKFVFHETCFAIHSIEELSKDMKAKVSANITGSSALMAGFTTNIDDAVTEMKIDPKNLWIEITEQDTMTVTENTLKKIEYLKGEGHSFLIDDFGMGHTSISYLQTKIFNVIKLDGSITRNVLMNKEEQKIIRSVTEMGHSLGMTIIAEFVETEEQRDLLHELGCDVFQGYLYSKPIPLDEMLEKIKYDCKEQD